MERDYLRLAPSDVPLSKVLIIEETDLSAHKSRGAKRVPSLFLRRLASKSGNSLIPLDNSIDCYIVKLHVIFPSSCQFYSAGHLESNPHYTVRDGDELSCLVRDAISRGISVKYYDADSNHLDDDCVRVLNNVHLSTFSNRLALIPWADIFYAMKELKSVDDQRGSYTSHVGFSATLGQGWHNPYPELDKYAGELGLCKPGITSSMPRTLSIAMGPSLAFTGELSQFCWGTESVNTDLSRQIEFSNMLGKFLGCSSPVIFEAGTFALLRGERQNLAVHTDVLNDGSIGYEKTGVLSMFVVDSGGVTNRLTVIGYNRKCCYDFMQRMREAQANKLKASSICNLFHTLQLKKQRNLRCIEAAACFWLSKCGVKISNNNWDKLYSGLELTAAQSIVRSVTVRRLNAAQESRPQIARLRQLVATLYKTLDEVLADISCICRALTFLISAHAKNHKLNGVQLLDDIQHRDRFQKMFISYDAVMRLLPLPSEGTDWVDVYGEYTFNKLYSTLSPTVFDERLNRFASEVRSEMLVDELIKKLHRHKVFILGGSLFQIFAVVLFKEIGVVVPDENYMTYLPHKFAKTSGSVKLLQRHAGMADPYVCREYMKHFAKQIGTSAVTYENILCKFQVGYFAIRRKTNS